MLTSSLLPFPGGQVTDSQLFKFKGRAGPLRLKPRGAAGSCLTVAGNSVTLQACTRGNKSQHFAFGGAPANNVGGGDPNDGLGSETPAASTSAPSKTATSATSAPAATTTSKPVDGGRGGNNPPPTGVTSVSRAGGVLNPTAVAEAQAFDKTATRFFESVSIQSSDGRCLSVDPTAGDFRENLIPVALVACKKEPAQRFDIITKGKHNDGTQGKSALISSVLVSFLISPWWDCHDYGMLTPHLRQTAASVLTAAARLVTKSPCFLAVGVPMGVSALSPSAK